MLLERFIELQHHVSLQVGGISQEADYEYLGQDGFCHDRKHGGGANAGLTRLKVTRAYKVFWIWHACFDYLAYKLRLKLSSAYLCQIKVERAQPPFSHGGARLASQLVCL